MNTSNNTVQPPIYTSSTTSAPIPRRKPSSSTTLTYNLFPYIPTAATPLNVRSAPSRIIFVLYLPLATPTPPPKEWDRLIPQAVLTLNLIHSFCKKLSLYAHAAIKGNFDFNATPLAPPGIKVFIPRSGLQPALIINTFC